MTRGPGKNMERYERALAMRLEGVTFREIGRRLGVTHQRAQQMLSPTPTVARKIKERAGNRCEECQEPAAGNVGHVHHRAAVGMTAESYNAEPNLTLLCNSCHRKAHANPLAAEWNRRRLTPEEKAASAQSRAWAASAKRIGIDLDVYLAHRAADERWCYWHRDWHPFEQMTANRQIAGGRGGRCDEANREMVRTYQGPEYRIDYVQKNRDKVNAYQREYHRRRRAAQKSVAS